ncbi:MAG: efflux RND transporter permease subunit, partial [Elusimicrobiaceae bacterium]
VPAQDQSIFMIRVQTPIGSSFDFTNSVMQKIEKWALAQPNVNECFGAVGGMGGGQVNTGMLFLTLKPVNERTPLPGKKRPPTQQEFMQITRKAMKAVEGIERVSIQDPSLSGFTSQRGMPVELSLRGPDWGKLGDFSELLIKKMNESGKMVDVNSDYQLGMPELRIIPDREKAAARGVSVSSIGTAINAMIGGTRAGKFTKNGKRYDIRVKLVNADISSPKDLNKIWVRNNRGEVIQLSEVVKIEQKPSLLSISRRNRERAIGLFANPAPGVSQAEALAAAEKLGKEVLPEGYRLILSGSSQTYQESFQSLFVALMLGIFVAYMVLASQFNSFIHPVTVLLALPFSVTGAFAALYLGGRTLNIYSIIGIILLMGIVKKNSILLVDFTNQRRAQGFSVNDALLDACPIRLRPILMTSVATITAAIAPALGLGPGAEARIPMALVVIGGVLVSTLLTLLVVPCSYSLFAKLEHRGRNEEITKAFAELEEKK